MRRLQVTIPGRWYLALTVGLGVVALTSNNNIIYLIESLLLGGLILSGILSERQISAVQVDIRRFPASAGLPARDLLSVRNLKRFPLFCLEIGEWKDKKFVPLAFIPKVDAYSTSVVTSKRVFDKRGPYQWEGYSIATSYPFGFARKLKVVDAPGERIIWPVRQDRRNLRRDLDSHRQRGRFGKDVAEGEIRPFNQDDDARMVVWLFSGKGTGEFVRPRRSEQSPTEVTLDLRQEAGDVFEEQIVSAASPFYDNIEDKQSGTLTLQSSRGKKKFKGRMQVLNQLGCSKAEGRGK